MPTYSDYDSDRIDQVEREEGGRGLRKILEAALAENRKAYEENASLKAQRAVEVNGLSLVKPEDLAGVDVDDIEARALELQQEREAQRVDVVRTLFADRGLEGSELDKAVADFMEAGSGDGSAVADQWSGVTTAQGVRGEALGAMPKVAVDLLDPMAHLIAAESER